MLRVDVLRGFLPPILAFEGHLLPLALLLLECLLAAQLELRDLRAEDGPALVDERAVERAPVFGGLPLAGNLWRFPSHVWCQDSAHTWRGDRERRA